MPWPARLRRQRTAAMLFWALATWMVCIALTGMSWAAELPHVLVNDPMLDPNPDQGSPAFATLATPVPIVLVAWTTSTSVTASHAIRLALSTNGGATFAQLGAPPAPTDWYWRGDAVLAADPLNGRIWLCAQAEKSGIPERGLLALSGYFDGMNWQWNTPRVIRSTSPSGLTFPNRVALAVSSLDGRVYVAFHDEDSSPHRLDVQYSSDGGGTWSMPNTVDTGDFVGQQPQLELAPDGDLLLFYGRTYGGGAGGEATPALRVSEDGGLNFGPPIALPSFIGPRGGPPGQQNSFNFGDHARSIAIDRTVYEHAGRIYACWAESFDYYADFLPPSPSFLDAEPNNTPGTAQSAPSSCTLSGQISTGDQDWFSITLAAGDRLVLHPDRLTGQLFSYRMRIVGPDGNHSLTNWAVGGSAPDFLNVGFTPPATATYYVVIEPTVANTTYGIRFGVMSTAPMSGRARDRHDVFVSWTDNRTTWSTPAMVTLSEAAGLDDNLPAVAVGPDGRPYVTWNGYFMDGTGGAVGAPFLARSNDGGASWGPANQVTLSPTDWGASFAQGAHNPLRRAGDRIVFAWADGRTGNLDTYLGAFPAALETTCPANAETQAGGTVELVLQLRSQNPMLSDNVWVDVESERAWEMTSPLQPFAAPPSGQPPQGYSFFVAVPETAAVGVNRICMRLKLSPTGAPRETCCVAITVKDVTGVEARGPLAGFGLRAVTPNPAVSSVRCRFVLPQSGRARLTAFDLNGRCMRVLRDQILEPGAHEAVWDGKDERGRRKSGLYFLRLEQAGQVSLARLAILE